MRVAISPCPNDTYLFYGWSAGIARNTLPAEIHYADIEQLNQWALNHHFPLIKLSFPCFAKVSSFYQCLPIGSALGFNCGPKIVAKDPFSLSELSDKRVAIPGYETTAHYLYERLLTSPKEKIFAPYHDILRLIEEDVADCGVIIHETRFTFEKAGYVEIADLGKLWEIEKKLPLPLGGLAIARELPNAIKNEVLATLKASLLHAKSNPAGLLPFISNHAQEKNLSAITQHIALYVNSETERLSKKGSLAIETLIGSPLPSDWLYVG